MEQLTKGTVVKVKKGFKTTSHKFAEGDSFQVWMAAGKYNALMWKFGKTGKLLSQNDMKNNYALSEVHAAELIAKGYIELLQPVAI